jgi:hypothetical protein
MWEQSAESSSFNKEELELEELEELEEGELLFL